MTESRLVRAVAPNLFDVVADSDLAFALVLANLMSPHLWMIRDRLLEPVTSGESEGESESQSEGEQQIAQRVHHLLDQHFEHLSQARVAEKNGTFDSAALIDQYGADTVDYTLACIRSTMDWRIARGTLKDESLARELFAQRRIPAYVYATIDEAWACRRLLRGRKHKPWGLTCCLDEAAIVAALHPITTGGSPDNLVILGSPSHYSVLVWSANACWWFYSKHELFTESAWSGLVDGNYGGDRQAAFDDRQPDFDRIITASGSYSFATGERSISQARLQDVMGRIDGFFGGRLAQFERALGHPHGAVVDGASRAILTAAAAATSVDGVRAAVRHAAFDGGSVQALQALHAYRTLDVPDPSVYLRAARESSRLHGLLPEVKTTDDALKAVAAITGRESIFDDAARIAMPVETLRFATGTDRDRALLLHVLLERSGESGLETLLGESDSFVTGRDFCISLSRNARVAAPEGRILYRMS